jgi:diaminohydroxyphosphoribosylaminopyrimidine deaminase/5-amino-6-(5-phosphoribosylamino)uracil reductase
MIEGGAQVLGSAFDARLVDEVWAFVAPIVIGGGQPAVMGKGPDLVADAFRLSDVRTEALGPDMLVRGLTNINHQEASCSLAS